MSKLQTKKTELETLRDQWRQHAAAHPNDPAAVDALREIESQLATVNAQRIYGQGAQHVVNAAIGRASIAAQRNPQRAAATPTPTPAPMPTAQQPAAPPRPSFVSETDVPWPTAKPLPANAVFKSNGRNANAPQPVSSTNAPTAAQPVSSTNAPDVAPTAPAKPRPSFVSETDVPWPQSKPLPANEVFRNNGRR